MGRGPARVSAREWSRRARLRPLRCAFLQLSSRSDRPGAVGFASMGLALANSRIALQSASVAQSVGYYANPLTALGKPSYCSYAKGLVADCHQNNVSISLQPLARRQLLRTPTTARRPVAGAARAAAEGSDLPMVLHWGLHSSTPNGEFLHRPPPRLHYRRQLWYPAKVTSTN